MIFSVFVAVGILAFITFVGVIFCRPPGWGFVVLGFFCFFFFISCLFGLLFFLWFLFGFGFVVVLVSCFSFFCCCCFVLWVVVVGFSFFGLWICFGLFSGRWRRIKYSGVVCEYVFLLLARLNLWPLVIFHISVRCACSNYPQSNHFSGYIQDSLKKD